MKMPQSHLCNENHQGRASIVMIRLWQAVDWMMHVTSWLSVMADVASTGSNTAHHTGCFSFQRSNSYITSNLLLTKDART